jgi:hypothetical protein
MPFQNAASIARRSESSRHNKGIRGLEPTQATVRLSNHGATLTPGQPTNIYRQRRAEIATTVGIGRQTVVEASETFIACRDRMRF